MHSAQIGSLRSPTPDTLGTLYEMRAEAKSLEKANQNNKRGEI